MAALAISSAFPWRALAWQEAVLEVPAPDRLADPDEPSAVEVMEEDPFGVPDGDVSPDSDASDASVAGEERDSGAGPAVTGRSRRPPPRNRPLPIDMKIDRKVPIPPPAPFHMGREIAQTMHYTGAPWLVRESRQREEDCRMMIEALGVRPGQTVCDMGAGNGFYTLELARMVGPEGLVYAVDIQPQMLQMLSRRAAQEGLANIRLVLGSPIDPRLPADKIDLVLCVDVYHEFSHPEAMLHRIRESLSDDGRLVLVEFRGEDPAVPIKPLHKMTKAQVRAELEPAGFRVAREFDRLPWQHLLFFSSQPD
jgi:precorrin-6B methylase 2